MKTFTANLSITVITVIGLTTLFTLSPQAGWHHKKATLSQPVNTLVTPANYGELMNNMFGR